MAEPRLAFNSAPGFGHRWQPASGLDDLCHLDENDEAMTETMTQVVRSIGGRNAVGVKA